MTEAQQKKIIAAYLRHVTNDGPELSDQQIIDHYGGDTANKIVAEFDNGTCLYISIDSSITVFIVIDMHDLQDSFSAELCDYSLTI